MITELFCAWCICTVSHSTLIECSACNVGTQAEGLKRISQFATQTGQMAMLECKKPNEKFELDWSAKGLKGVK